jgi:hypothetical protein
MAPSACGCVEQLAELGLALDEAHAAILPPSRPGDGVTFDATGRPSKGGEHRREVWGARPDDDVTDHSYLR